MAHPSRQGSPEMVRQPALSSFLQEKLQRERKAESDKLAFSASLSRADMSASVDIGRIVQTSLFKAPDPLGGRPRSSAGMEPPKKRGLGLKEMEQVVSSLHKQNFDLKLELFHRRERQTALEERIEALDANRKKTHDVTDRLVEELEKRDKAVEEAVAMIVMLEAKVDQLVTERCMVQRVESAGLFSTRDFGSSYGTATPQAAGPRVTKLDDDVKVVNRMPSFLSERSENTEHLRTVYLGVRGGSTLSLPRVAEGSVEPDGTPAQPLASPTLSVLSESSFVSVYGQKDQGKELGQMPPAFVDEPLTLDGLDVGLNRPCPDDAPASRRRAASVGRVAGIGKPPPRSSTAVPLQSITGVIGYESPLQRIMRLDPAIGLDDSPVIPAHTAPSRRPTKEEKREALRRVLTDGPGGARLHDQGMPPTPDTISTSTLHRFKNSNETLLQEQELNGALLQTGPQDAKTSEPASGVPLSGHLSSRHGSGDTGDGTSSTHTDHRQATALRTQTAREPAVFRKGGNDWDSDSDDTDTRSLESSLDIWLRESAKPDNQVSPDLFSFPTNTAEGGWAAQPMYGGANSGQTEGASIAPSQSHMHGLLSLRHQLFPWTSGPQPPDRRSSLHAHTGSTFDGFAAAASNDGGSNSASTRARHGKKQSEDTQKRADLRTPVQQPQAPPPQPGSDQKRYPPISGQQGARAGLNRLLRRSIGAGSSSNAPAEDAPASTTAETGVAAEASKNYHPMGVPSWVLRNGPAEDERSGATPPPIVLNPRQARRNTCEAERPASPLLPAEATPATNAPQDVNEDAKMAPAQQSEGSGTGAGASTGPGSRRKWLPAFGRPNTSKNKTS
ncbi:hypothetical protein HRG_000839 [Hirsutella rhossiliensis]|uniref:Centrosomin N-terminal motif 1 domain-containing protein n=1 Tax=Hirsutella rhossiliensis TaxID=111463 RepID=A0A9P8N7Y1_9HYPO|nr:uncharacterized protein HRG_00839 [Hirsutella rhossiliensis]KAH0968197.1 hypothetical protein HRG_00839 [Hirsutella rhossiliensis]